MSPRPLYVPWRRGKAGCARERRLVGSSHGVGAVSGGVRGREPFDLKQWGAPLRNANMGKESVGSPAVSLECGGQSPIALYFISLGFCVWCSFRTLTEVLLPCMKEPKMYNTSLPWITIIHLYRKMSAVHTMGILLSLKQEGHSDTYHDVEETW